MADVTIWGFPRSPGHRRGVLVDHDAAEASVHASKHCYQIWPLGNVFHSQEEECKGLHGPVPEGEKFWAAKGV